MASKTNKKAYQIMKASQEVCLGADYMQANQAKRHTRKQKQVNKYAPEPIICKPIKQKGIPEDKSKSRSMPRSRF